MKHTNDVEEGQNVNTLSEIEEYYKAREQQLLKKLHQQGAALAAAEQALKQLTENQKVSEDETARQRAAREQAFEEKLYRDPLTGIYNRRYYEEVARKTIGPAGVALMDVDDFKIWSIWRKAEKSFAHGGKPDISLWVFLDIKECEQIPTSIP